MQSPLSRYLFIAKRWAWVIILGIVICSGITFIISKFATPVYQASAFLVINLNTASYRSTSDSIAVVPTYATFLTNPSILDPVLAKHPGMTLQQLDAMISVKPQANTQVIELDVQNSNAKLAMQIANEISQSFAYFSNTQLPGTVQILPAQVPSEPVGPKPLLVTGIGALAGLGLAIALIVIFEWIDDRPTSIEEIQELLDMDILAVIPNLPPNQSNRKPMQVSTPAEKYRTLCASLNAAQDNMPLKLMMVTSAIADEGKSTIAANLALFLALTGKQVLLVDADLHHPTLAQRFQLNNEVGLSTIFVEQWVQPKMELYGQPTDIPGLRILTAGTVLSNPPELLQSQLAKQIFEHFRISPFDYVIFDTSSLLPDIDAQIIASLVQTVVLVVDASKTPRRVLRRTKAALKRTNCRVLGAVINKSPWSDSGGLRLFISSIQQSSNMPILISPNTPPNTPSIIPPTTRINSSRSHLLIRPPIVNSDNGHTLND